ncbi:hypothetical protein J2Y00_002470 [Deinococcus soli (ex Cha et al. 2016)]|uniref:Uncharacterized protein n=2 Tax=Deinococcus soli (ex Cha et al. 2016) TaxID=1309411 RepID=A0ACC6KH36_9DEIO|nr:hypothetical protein [Deinococcus soli (ex Cha et al. 2016)]MDR6328670.1 hypothetical protein [Deinococcus soli (ex Cha et al. 2016)]MDR6751843.1 hypothetical protein [Deinococcus soli (ex Cha et al. 2016)]
MHTFIRHALNRGRIRHLRETGGPLRTRADINWWLHRLLC